MHDKHEPDPRFVESLEWQLGRELRRVKRMGTGPRPAVRALKMGGLMLGSIVFGAAAMGFSQQLSDSWRRELLEARLEVQLELAQRRVAVQLEALGLTREQVEQGVRSDRDLVYYELQIAQAEVDAKIMTLELEEIRRSGREPQDALSSPLIDGRDFVSEKIQARMEVARRHLEVVRYDVARTQERAEVGVVSEDEVRARNLIARQAELELQSLNKQLELRRAYLDSEITAVEVELKLLEAEAQNQLAILDRQSAHFEREMERYEASVGSVPPAVAVQLRAQIAEIEAQLRLAQAELEIVQRELELRGLRR